MNTILPDKCNLIKRVAFFGDANIPETDPDYIDAYQTAKLLAENELVIVNGGGPGLMDASTQGAESVGGKTVAVTMKPKFTSSFEGRYLKNLDMVDREVVKSNYIERMFGLIEESDLFMVFRGGSGTLSELGTVWVLANIYYGHHKPMILFGNYWWQIIEVLTQNLNFDEQELSCMKIVETPKEAMAAILHFEWKFQQNEHKNLYGAKEAAFML
jgi:uncharacterized protein (TIGR00725 family)